jgi:hypothetical protein
MGNTKQTPLRNTVLEEFGGEGAEEEPSGKSSSMRKQGLTRGQQWKTQRNSQNPRSMSDLMID